MRRVTASVQCAADHLPSRAAAALLASAAPAARGASAGRRATRRCCASLSGRRDQLRPGADQRPLLAHRHARTSSRRCYTLRPSRAARSSWPLDRRGMPEMSATTSAAWTVRLRPGIYFADDPAFKGKQRELVAQDYVYSFKRFADPALQEPGSGPSVEELRHRRPATSCASRRSKAKQAVRLRPPIEGLRALDRYTLQFKLREPRPRFSTTLADARRLLGAVAREVVEVYGDEIMRRTRWAPGRSGWQQWRRSSRIVLERNPSYRECCYDAEPARRRRRRPGAAGSASRAGACRWSTGSRSRSSRRSSRAGCRS